MAKELHDRSFYPLKTNACRTISERGAPPAKWARACAKLLT